MGSRKAPFLKNATTKNEKIAISESEYSFQAAFGGLNKLT
jgi:hypothetical protein